jgi:XTP/dITP diphosphohydrolase
MKIVFATHNQNKVNEIQKIMPAGITIVGLDEIGCHEDIPETQPTIEGNALQKAEYVWNKYKVNCFADDTGLEVFALNREPGVYSARYAGPDKNPDKNMDLLLERLSGKEDRSARFLTVIALIIDGEKHVFEGEVLGEIRFEKIGNQGFGYDPIFEPEKCGSTFAQMSLEEKNQKSHRARAVLQMIDFLILNPINRKD